MIYKGNVCDGCGRVFTEDDDIVVCPICATPQHRECYDKGDCCVNSQLHSDTYEWKSTLPAEEKKKEDAPAEGESTETSPCPNCGYPNPKGTRECKNCSMKLVVFGIDLADTIEDKKDTPPRNSDAPSYKPPFTLGEGEGFDNADEAPQQTNFVPEQLSVEKETPAASPEQIGQSVLDSASSTAYDAYQQSFVSGVKVKLLNALIGSNSYKYIEKFRKMDEGKKISFNWAAFFFSPYWFFYRKLYKPGIIFMTIYLLLSILVTPAYNNFTDVFIPFAENPELFNGMTDEAYIELIIKLSEALAPVMLFSFANFAVNLVCGFIANGIYRKYIINSAKTVVAAQTKTMATMLITKYGGISLIALLLSYFAEQGISLIASYLMF